MSAFADVQVFNDYLVFIVTNKHARIKQSIVKQCTFEDSTCADIKVAV